LDCPEILILDLGARRRAAFLDLLKRDYLEENLLALEAVHGLLCRLS
jgi:hypothetical protein